MIHVSGKKYKTKISLLSGQLITGCRVPLCIIYRSRFQLGASVLTKAPERSCAGAKADLAPSGRQTSPDFECPAGQRLIQWLEQTWIGRLRKIHFMAYPKMETPLKFLT